MNVTLSLCQCRAGWIVDSSHQPDHNWPSLIKPLAVKSIQMDASCKNIRSHSGPPWRGIKVDIVSDRLIKLGNIDNASD